jgi:hypothetical protein
MGAAAADGDVETVTGTHQGVADVAQLRQQLGVAVMHGGRDLEHAFGNLGLDVAGEGLVAEQVEQVAGRAGEVEVGPVDQLQLEFDSHAQGCAGLEGLEGHFQRPSC